MDLKSELLKSIWYAFTSLDVERCGKVSKSQLKVSRERVGTFIDSQVFFLLFSTQKFWCCWDSVFVLLRLKAQSPAFSCGAQTNSPSSTCFIFFNHLSISVSFWSSPHMSAPQRNPADRQGSCPDMLILSGPRCLCSFCVMWDYGETWECATGSMWPLCTALLKPVSSLQVLSHNLYTVLNIPHDPVALEEHFQDDDDGPVSNHGYMPYLNKYILNKVSPFILTVTLHFQSGLCNVYSLCEVMYHLTSSQHTYFKILKDGGILLPK